MTNPPPDFGPGSVFRVWIATTMIPQLALALNAPCLTANPYSMESLLSQYALLSRTPPAIDRGYANIVQGLPAMKDGIKHFAGECYVDYGPYELRRSHVCSGNGAVVIECFKKVGRVEHTISVWAFVPKNALRTPEKGCWTLVEEKE